jgi:mono/diheme cytochrome c family protein
MIEEGDDGSHKLTSLSRAARIEQARAAVRRNRDRAPRRRCSEVVCSQKWERPMNYFGQTAMKRSLLVLSTIGLLWSTFAHAVDEEQRHAKELLQKLCARCHSVGRTGASLNRQAPPFRSFSETKLYDSDFMQRLQDGLTSIHPFMPTFRLNRDDAAAVLNYTKSIQEPPKPK